MAQSWDYVNAPTYTSSEPSTLRQSWAYVNTPTYTTDAPTVVPNLHARRTSARAVVGLYVR